MAARVFIDTNIWIYGLTKPQDGEESDKRQKTLELLSAHTKASTIVASVQVINEFHWNMIKKFGFPDSVAADLVSANITPITTITALDYSTYRKASELRQKHSFSFWDSLIAASALNEACEMLFSEDMQDGLLVENLLRIVNPFKVSAIGVGRRFARCGRG